MDVSVALRTVENLVRDTLHFVLSTSIGPSWVETCGVSSERIVRWKERKEEDEARNGRSDPRLIYYSDFYDLTTIIRKQWDLGLREVFSDLKETEVLLRILEDMRNPDAHRREFLPFENQLAMGIAGRLRTQVTKYFSMNETAESYYPRIEFAQDSLGNSCAMGQGKAVIAPQPLRPGAQLQFKIVASDPLGEKVEYSMFPNANYPDIEWNETGEFSFEILESYVANAFWFFASVRSARAYHAMSDHRLGPIDDQVMFRYTILPPRTISGEPV